MPLRVLIAPDKFKGTLSAQAAAEAIARGWRQFRAQDKLMLLPISDGGDGFGNVTSKLFGARAQTITTVDAAHRSRRAQWWWEPRSKTAIIESANVIGLAHLPVGKFHPFALDTYGLGAVIRAAKVRGAQRCVIGIGGSATNDGGFGVARALGWEFLDDAGQPIESWTELHRLKKIKAPRAKKWFKELIVAVDVQNLLLGKKGCSRIYGPQKGLRPEDFSLAEHCLKRLANVTHEYGVENKNSFAAEAAVTRGSGAAGGLGFGVRAFLNARLEPGFDLFAKLANLDAHLENVDVVITGEGAMDASTMMGKGVGELALRCQKERIPCIGLAGTVIKEGYQKQKWFAAQRSLTDLTTPERAKAEAALWLERLAKKVAVEWNPPTRGKSAHTKLAASSAGRLT